MFLAFKCHLLRLKSIVTIYSFENSNLECLAGNKIMRAGIFRNFPLKRVPQVYTYYTKSCFLLVKTKWKTKLRFPWFRNDACSRLMVHLFTNRFCAHSSNMPFNHVESAMKCFTAVVHNPQIQRNKWGISIFWGYLSS